MFIDAIPLI